MQQMKYFLWLLILLLLTGCGVLADVVEGNGRSASDAAEAASEGDKLAYDGAKPAEGTGNVFGEIRWNSHAAANLDIELCSDYSFFSGCGGTSFIEKTDENGRYLFKDIEPGVYAIAVRLFESDEWLFISGGILSAADFEVEAGKTLVVDVQNIFKLDLKPLIPINGGKVAGEEVRLDWTDYPDAAYYYVSLFPDEGDAIVYEKRVNESTTMVELLPVSCGYRWGVEAFNSDRVKIAETAEQFEFVVEGLNGSCWLAIQEPADGAEIRGDDIVLDWDDSPLATTYKILMWNDDDPERTNVLNFEVVNESSYRFAETLVPARYVWSVTAYDDGGNKIGGTEIYDFFVRP